MAAPRLSPILLRSFRLSIPHTARPQRPLPSLPRRFALPTVAYPQSRFYSQDSKPSKIYSFEDVSTFLAHPSPSRILIDTREPAELAATGTIPGAVNIPITTSPDAFFISAEEFEDRFGFERPGTEQEVVFYCRSGVRSRAAAELARQAGWGAVGEYPGSWTEWAEKGGVKEGGRGE